MLTHHVVALSGHSRSSRESRLPTDCRLSRDSGLLVDVARLLPILRVLKLLLLPQRLLLLGLLGLRTLAVGPAAESGAALHGLAASWARSLELLELIQKTGVILNHLGRELLDVLIVRPLLGQFAHLDFVFIPLDQQLDDKVIQVLCGPSDVCTSPVKVAIWKLLLRLLWILLLLLWKCCDCDRAGRH
jgi:hypothetical protein